MTSAAESAPAGTSRKLDRPIFIVSTPRSGSTLLFETLEQAQGACSTGNESHALIERVPGLSPHQRNWSSNRLTAEDATLERVEALSAAFCARLRDRDGRVPQDPVRLIEKTPKNALRVPFFDAAYPECYFVYLYRDVRQTLSSMIEAWQSGRFRTYPRLPGWTGPSWSLLLVPNWQQLIGEPLPIVVARQWATTTTILLDDLEQIPEERVRGVNYAQLLAEPQKVMPRLATSLGLTWDRPLGTSLPYSRTTISRPDPEKWRSSEAAIAAAWPIVEAADARARAFADRLKV